MRVVRVARIVCVSITVTIAVGVLVGWGVGNSYLVAVVPGMTAMNPLTSVCFILAATALVRSPVGATGLWRGWIVGVALAIGGCGMLRLSACVFGWDLPIDQLLFSSRLDLGGGQLNRMAPNTAFNFAAVGFALGALVTGRLKWAQVAVILMMLTSGIALLGYAYSATSLLRVASFIPMALHSAGLFMMVGAAALCAMPEVGMLGMLSRRSPGGHVIRLMLPAFVVGPPLIGWLRLQGELIGLYTPSFGVAMLIGAMIALGFALTWKTARAMDRGDFERRRADEMLRKLAHYDSLTGLPNRLLLGDRLGQALARAERSGGTVAMLFLDLDGFKHVNDTFGHETGDQVLCEAARRILASVRTVDTAARLGGDEFIVVLEHVKGAEDASVVTRRLLERLSQPYSGVEARLSVSIGVSLYPVDAPDPDDLMKLADAAMYRAKRAGKNQVAFHAATIPADTVKGSMRPPRHDHPQLA